MNVEYISDTGSRHEWKCVHCDHKYVVTYHYLDEAWSVQRVRDDGQREIIDRRDADRLLGLFPREKALGLAQPDTSASAPSDSSASAPLDTSASTPLDTSGPVPSDTSGPAASEASGPAPSDTSTSSDKAADVGPLKMEDRGSLGSTNRKGEAASDPNASTPSA